MVKTTAAAIAAVLALGCQHAAPAVRGPPTGIQLFTRHAQFVDVKISPGGTYLAAIRLDGGKRSLAFIDLKTRKLASYFRPSPESVGDFHWVNDSRVAVDLLDEEGTLATPVSTGEIYAIEAATGRGRMVFGYRAGKQRELAWGSILGRPRGEEHKVLVETTHYFDEGDRVFSIYKLDAYSGVKTLVTASPVPGTGFVLDEDGEPRIFRGSTLDVREIDFYRDPGGRWTNLGGLKGLTSQSQPVGFLSRKRTMMVVEPLEKGFGLFAVRVDTGERKLLSRNDWAPPRDYLLDPESTEILAVEYEADVPSWEVVVPDHPLARLLKGLLAAYPDENVRIVSTTDDQKKAVVLVYGDRDPGRFLLVDVATLSAEEVAAVRPWIHPDAMAETSAFHIKAGDGAWIHGYLTVPARAAGAPPPLVVIPHGGPHGVRDVWGFQPEVQLLAREGYAVLQVNFRGSGGYGLSFQEAGYRHWGDRMMQDIIDATRYAIGKGSADGSRVCIYGGSFGGYSALQASILAPDLFRCAIGYAGVYDLGILRSEGDIGGTRMGRGFLRRVVGEDEGALRQASPVYNVDRLRARVLLIHGKQDRRAPIEHAERLRSALQQRGIEPQWLVESKEGHGFYDEDARERMYARLLQFLRESLQQPAR